VLILKKGNSMLYNILKKCRISGALFLCVFLFMGESYGATQVDRYGNSIRTKRKRTRITGGQNLRKRRRVGLGIATSGIYGALGANMELNFTPSTGVILGFGLAKGYQTFSFQVKKIIGGNSFMPYISGGYAQWYTTGIPSINFKTSSPSILSEKFLSNNEKKNGFQEHLLFGSVGIQYLQLKAPYQGTSVFGEVTLIVDVDDVVIAPLGSLGLSFYF